MTDLKLAPDKTRETIRMRQPNAHFAESEQIFLTRKYLCSKLFHNLSRFCELKLSYVPETPLHFSPALPHSKIMILHPLLPILLATAFCVLTSSRAEAGNRQDGRYWTEIRPERLVTETEPFAADYVRPPKVLFLVAGKIAPREVAELQQRLKLEFGAVLYQGDAMINALGSNNMYIAPIEGAKPEEKSEELERLLQKKWDVIVFGHNTIFNALSPREQYEVLQRVANGAGLVIFASQADVARRGFPLEISKGTPVEVGEGILPGVPVPLLAPFQASSASKDSLAKRWDFGKGRVIWMNSRGNGDGNQNTGIHALTPYMPYSPEEEVYYDEYLSAAAKAIVAANPATAPRVVPAAGNPRVAEIAAPAQAAGVSVGTFTLPEPVTVKAVVRDLTGIRVDLPDVSLKAGDAVPVEFAVPPLAAGPHFLNYRMVSQAGTEYWGTLGLNVAPGRSTIASLGVPDEVPKLHKKKDGFVLPVALTGENLKGLTLSYEGQDRDGRVIFEGSMPVSAPSMEIRAPLDLAASIPHLLKVELLDGKNPIATKRVEFFVSQPMPEFVNLIWGGPFPTVLGLPKMAQLRKAGFNTFMYAGKGNISLEVARGNAHAMDYCFRVLVKAPGPKDGPDDSFANPAYLQAQLDKPNNAANKSSGPYKDYIHIYNLGDENGFDYSRAQVPPSELAGFQAMVKKEYGGDLALLNKEWSSNDKSFEEVTPPDMNTALPMKEIPRKLAWMRFIETLYASVHHQVSDVIKKNDPDPAKFIGAEGSKMGDPELTLPGLTMWGPYPNRLDNALMRSFGSPDLLRGNWWGGYLRERSSGGQPLWEQVLSGGVNSSFYFMDLAGEGMLGSEFGLADYFEKDQWPVMLEVNAGIGPLLGHLAPEKAGVGILFSQASDHAQTVDVRFGSVGSTRNGLLAWTDAIAVPAFFYSEKQVGEGKLATDGVKILFLPQSLSLDDPVAGALKKWVESGGILVADVRPGMRNIRGASREAGLLDSLFGVKQSAEGAPREATVQWAVSDGKSLELPGMVVDSELKPDGATPAVSTSDGVPLVLTRTLGKGRTILLNFTLGKALANQMDDPALNAWMRSLLKEAGVSIELEVPSGYMVNRFRSEGLELLSCRILPGAAENGVIRLPQKMHVYDVRAGKSLGETDEIVPSAGAGRNTLYALSPKPIAPFTAAAKGEAKRGAVLPIIVKPATDDGLSRPRRLYRLDLVQPDGVEVPNLRAFQWGADAVTFEVPLALNLPAGIYTARITDIVTGQSESVAITLPKE